MCSNYNKLPASYCNSNDSECCLETRLDQKMTRVIDYGDEEMEEKRCDPFSRLRGIKDPHFQVQIKNPQTRLDMNEGVSPLQLHKPLMRGLTSSPRPGLALVFSGCKMAMARWQATTTAEILPCTQGRCSFGRLYLLRSDFRLPFTSSAFTTV